MGLLPKDGAPIGPLEGEEFYKLLTEYMVGSYETSAGWTYWNFKNEIRDPRWSFFDARNRSWFAANLSLDAYAPRRPNCAAADSLFGDLYATFAVWVGSVVAAVGCLVALCAVARARMRRACATRQAARARKAGSAPRRARAAIGVNTGMFESNALSFSPRHTNSPSTRTTRAARGRRSSR